MRERHDELKTELFDQSYENFAKCDSFLEKITRKCIRGRHKLESRSSDNDNHCS